MTDRSGKIRMTQNVAQVADIMQTCGDVSGKVLFRDEVRGSGRS
jgi:hypothetical protein